MQVRKVIRFEFEGGHDVEFANDSAGRMSAWVDGVFVEHLAATDRPGELRAQYYLETFSRGIEEKLLNPEQVVSLQ